MRTPFFIIITILGCLVLPGCKQYIDWGKKTFQQADTIAFDREHITPFLRHTALYDQLATVLIMDTLYLNDLVAQQYQNLYAQRRFLTPTITHLMEQQNTEQQTRYVSFYLWANKQADNDILFSTTESTAIWRLTLCANNIHYQPITIEHVTLEPEYVRIFSIPSTKHRTAYLVRFLKDKDLTEFLSSHPHDLELILKSPDHTISISWND